MVQKHTCANRVPNSKIDQELAWTIQTCNIF
jgi:hypothetical protein